MILCTYHRVCFLVYLSRSGEAWEQVNGGQLTWFELAGLFPPSLLQMEVKRCQYDRQSTVETQLSLHKLSVKEPPQRTGTPRKQHG